MKDVEPEGRNSLVDPRAMARHYVVKSTSLPSESQGPSPAGELEENKSGIKRHYTEAFVMRPEVLQAFIDFAKEKDEKNAQIIIDAVKANNRDDLHLTIKGYTRNNGLSKFIHEDLEKKEHVYQITGPMGRGLNASQGGRHIAFCAGTGVLVFVDMIGHLILRQVAAQGGPDVLARLRELPEYADATVLPNNFKFELHTAFADKDEAIALPLIEVLESLDPEKKTFEHFGSLSKGGDKPPVRWDEARFKELFATVDATKIWVCGPPIMQESFDRAVM